METINQRNKIKKITIYGIGISLFVVLSLCLQVPVLDNYYLCLGYLVMAVYSYSIGTLAGTTVGTLGVILYCFLINGLRGMPGWAIGNIFIGIISGFAFKKSRNIKNKLFSNGICLFGIFLGTAIGILGAKSFIEAILYAQPMLIRVAKNTSAFIADVIVLWFSIPLCKILDSHIQKYFS